MACYGPCDIFASLLPLYCTEDSLKDNRTSPALEIARAVKLRLRGPDSLPWPAFYLETSARPELLVNCLSG